MVAADVLIFRKAASLVRYMTLNRYYLSRSQFFSTSVSTTVAWLVLRCPVPHFCSLKELRVLNHTWWVFSMWLCSLRWRPVSVRRHRPLYMGKFLLRRFRWLWRHVWWAKLQWVIFLFIQLLSQHMNVEEKLKLCLFCPTQPSTLSETESGSMLRSVCMEPISSRLWYMVWKRE